MVDIDVLLSNALEKYFDTLPITGNVDLADVNKLLALCAINYMINEFPELITNEDWVAISNALACLADGCLIEFPSQYSTDELIHGIKRNLDCRVTEVGNNMRNSVQDLIRIKV